MVAGLGSTWWQYLLLFLAVAASWAGVPVIGTAALGTAAVAASQDKLNLAAVIVIAVLAGEAGGLGGYAIGRRWGRRLLERPGKRQAGREKMMQRGERLYARWGQTAPEIVWHEMDRRRRGRHHRPALPRGQQPMGRDLAAASQPDSHRLTLP